MEQMLCGYRDDPRLWEQTDAVEMQHAKRVEDYADMLMADCKNFEMAELTNRDNDLYDGDLLPKLMTEIANWTGRSDDAFTRMGKLHNLLANELQKIAEREVV